MLVGRDVGKADLLDILERGAQAVDVGDVRRPRFELVGDHVIDGLLKSHRTNHITTALKGGIASSRSALP